MCKIEALTSVRLAWPVRTLFTWTKSAELFIFCSRRSLQNHLEGGEQPRQLRLHQRQPDCEYLLCFLSLRFTPPPRRAPTAPTGHHRNKGSLPLSNINFDAMLALLRRQPHIMRMFPSMNINDRHTANTPGENLLREGLRKDMHMTCFSFVKLKLIRGVLGNDCFWPWVMLIWHYFVFTVTMRLACCGYLLARCRF